MTSDRHLDAKMPKTQTPAAATREARRRAYGEFAQSWFKGLMDAAGHDITTAEAVTGVKYATLRRILNGATKSMQRGTLNQIAIGYRAPLPPELAAGPTNFKVVMPLTGTIHATSTVRGVLTSVTTEPDASAGKHSGSLVWDVPVHTLERSPHGGRYFWSRQPSSYAFRPPGILHSPRAFALRMPDLSMYPWRQANDLLFIDPNRATVDGDHALVELANPAKDDLRGLCMIRRVIVCGPDTITLATWEPGHKPEEIPSASVLRFYRVLELPEFIE